MNLVQGQLSNAELWLTSPVCMLQGEFTKAIELFTKCVELFPDRVVPYTNRALCYLRISEVHTTS